MRNPSTGGNALRRDGASDHSDHSAFPAGLHVVTAARRKPRDSPERGVTSRQRGIEQQLAAPHLAEGGSAMFDLSSSWVEGSCCELAAFGYSRDGKRGRRQIEYGLL